LVPVSIRGAAQRLPGNEVHVWQVPLSVGPAALQHLEDILGEDERRRAARFHFQRDRDRFVITHACLRLILARYLPLQPTELAFETGSYGKPALVGPDWLSFNLAHSADLAIYGITSESTLGVDVEWVQLELDMLSVGRRVFPPEAFKQLEDLPPHAQRAEFFELWTLLEACMKAAGTGMSMDPRTIQLEPTRTVARTPAVGSVSAADWTLHRLRVAPDYAAALAVANPEAIIHYWDRRPESILSDPA
jgi:4'-phosphopantetheinyl transferase